MPASPRQTRLSTFLGVLLLLSGVAARATDAPLEPTGTTPAPTEAASNDTAVILATVGAGAAAIGFGALAWWGGAEIQPLHLRSTGWFGHDTYSGGSDKAGHFIATYIGTIFVTHMYEALDVSREKSVLLASSLAFAVGNSVEFFDALTNFGFEYEDAIANTAGLGAAAAAMLSPAFHKTVGFRIGFVPSEHFAEVGTRIRKIAGLQRRARLINDYSGQTYYADLKIRGLADLLHADFGAAEYFLIGANYATNNYETTLDPEYLKYMKSRLVGGHIGLNLPEILDDSLPRSGWRSALSSLTRYYAVPMTTLQVVRDIEHRRTIVRFAAQTRVELP